MNIQYRDGLLYTSIKISYKNLTKIIDNVVIDTGASESILSPDIIYDLEIYQKKMMR